MAIELTALVIGFGILARIFLNLRRSLAATESERDSLRSALTLARREAEDLRLANQGLTEDLNGWRIGAGEAPLETTETVH